MNVQIELHRTPLSFVLVHGAGFLIVATGGKVYRHDRCFIESSFHADARALDEESVSFFLYTSQPVAPMRCLIDAILVVP